MKKLILLSVLFIITNFIIEDMHAQSFDNGGADDLWSTALNWSDDLVPNGSSDLTNTGSNVGVATTGQLGDTYWYRNSTLTIRSGGELTLGGSLSLTRGGGAAGTHDLIVEGTGILDVGNILYSTAGGNDTRAVIDISGTSSLTVTGNINQSQNHGTLTYEQSGGTANIGGNLNIGNIASTTAKNYQMNISGSSTLDYGTANLGTVAAASANTLVSLDGSNYDITAATATNLGLDGITTFTFDAGGIGIWEVGNLAIDAAHQFTIDLTGANQSDLNATFEIMDYTTLSGFDAGNFSFIGNASTAYAFDSGTGISIGLQAVPEPTTFTLFALGSLCFFVSSPV